MSIRNLCVRFERYIEEVKIIIDLFIESVPFTAVGEVLVVEPKTLLSYYDMKKHTTDDCVAVTEARKLLKQGISPVGRPELSKEP